MQVKSYLLISKLKYILFTVLLSLLVLSLYLFYLQINLVSFFYRLGTNNFLRTTHIASIRGDISDCHGRLLATNTPLITICWKGTFNKSLTNNQKALLKSIIDIINIDNTIKLDYEDILKHILKAEKQGLKYPISYNISIKSLSRILEQHPKDLNILINQEFKRYYPYNNLASHTVGYLNNSSLQFNMLGKMGLELVYENILQGKKGEIVTTINSYGCHLNSIIKKQAQAGKSIHTTLDLDLQQIIENIFPKEYKGACILMDPQTGAIKALLSYPSFNPNIFLNKITQKEWDLLSSSQCFINRACNACYPPASLFKLVTLAAALEDNIINSDDIWQCNGYTLFGKRRYHCNRRAGHGLLNTQQALAKSCNIPFYEIGKKITIDKLAYYATLLGLGLKTGIKLQEKSGLIPTSSWKQQTKHERWWPGETLSAVIGQSFILTTPLQIACMISSLCTGYKIKPRILIDDPLIKEKLNLKESTLDFLKTCMKQVVRTGTGNKLKQIDDFTIYAKTGTAQTSNYSKRKLGTQYKEHAWFMSYFTYKDQTPLTLVILLENAGSAQLATATANRFLSNYKTFINTKN